MDGRGGKDEVDDRLMEGPVSCCGKEVGTLPSATLLQGTGSPCWRATMDMGRGLRGWRMVGGWTDTHFGLNWSHLNEV